MKALRNTVLLAASALFLAWVTRNFGRITANQDGVIRFVLGVLFALLLLIRSKAAEEARAPRGGLILLTGVAGAVFAVAGIVFTVHQFEWLGIILMFYACLRWALPARFGRDIVSALFLVYWIHPLPGQVFGRFQLGMQRLSVEGSEWLLHCLNERVWADGFILHAGLSRFGVPESCSGMRTAVTVVLCTVGSSLLMRLRWFEVLSFVVLGVVQVLFLNILRITGMVLLAPRMSPEWGQEFLHDSLGIFLLVSILMVQLEASWWKFYTTRRRERREAVAEGRAEHPDRGSILPRFWRLFVRWCWLGMLLLLLAGTAAFVIYKRRPNHRAAMVSEVVNGLLRTDPAAAERAARRVLVWQPGRRDMKDAVVQSLVLRSKFAAALALLEELPPPLTTMEAIMKSRSLMATKRVAEAGALLERLPSRARELPAVAMIRAEYAAMRRRPRVVAENIVTASALHTQLDRVRALFPFLAAHQQWEAIVRSDRDRPYQRFAPALAAVTAHLRMRDLQGAAAALEHGLLRWPDEVRFLNSLATLALQRPGGHWEEHFARNLRSNVERLSPDRLAVYAGHAFELHRADLAWLVYRRLRALDPDDPALFLIPAKYGHRWFTFRRHLIGVKSGSGRDTIDLQPFLRQTLALPPLRSLWRAVPLADVLGSGAGLSSMRRRYLERAIAGFEARDRDGTLTRRMRMDYPVALALAGRFQEAHARLDRAAEANPGLREQAAFLHAAFYDQEGRPQEAYEALRRHAELVAIPQQGAHLILLNALMNMNLGVCALEAARRAEAAFPGSAEVAAAKAAIWGSFGFHEQALFILEQGGYPELQGLTAEMLYETGRFYEAEKLARGAGVSLRRDDEQPPQARVLPPAEEVVRPHWPEPLSPEAMRAAAARFRSGMEDAVSPLIRRLGRLELAWYEQEGRGEVSSPSRWKQGARDDLEALAGLYRLALLLARQQDYEGARVAASEAAALAPSSPVVRRVLLAVTQGDPDVVRAAAAACPNDPHVWLASLIARHRAGGNGAWAEREIGRAVSQRRFPVGTLVRAGEFMLNNGHAKAAAEAARYACEHARGLVPAHVLALRCALAHKDVAWALDVAWQGANFARDPTPFYKVIVALKAAQRSTDADMVSALEHLNRAFPDQSIWAEQLGGVYFMKGDTRRALSVLGELVERDIKGTRLRSLLLASEAARLEGEMDRSVRILAAARRLYPEDSRVLNNLVYNLAQNQRTLQTALDLLPALLRADPNSFAVLDTAAVVCMKAGRLEQANRFMDRALKSLERGAYGSADVQLNAAELAFRSGDLARARELAEQSRRNPDRSMLVEVGARELLRRIDNAVRE